MSKKTPKWDIDEGECNFWIIKDVGLGFVRDFTKAHGKGPSKQLTVVYPGKKFKWCTPYDENIELGKFFVKKMKDDKSYVDYVTEKFDEVYKTETAYLDKVHVRELDKLDDKELFDVFRELRKQFRSTWTYGLIFEPLNEILPRELEQRLEKYGCSRQEILTMLEIPEKSFMQQEKAELLKILLDKKDDLKITDHRKKYYWILTGHAGKIEINNSFFIKKMDELSESGMDLKEELRKLKEHRKIALDAKKKITKKYVFDDELLNLVYVVDKYGPSHNKRKEIFMKGVYVIECLLEEIGRRFGYSLEKMVLLDPDEVISLEDGKKFGNELFEERSGLVVIMVTPDSYEVIVGKKAEEMEKEDLGEDYEDIKELKGMGASHGKVKGRVKVIYSFADIKKMKKDDVLVSGMTKPEWVTAMKKALAIVTDEGGITCHAAIISRELRIPCVIGTRIGSKVLHDGDLVEVDANKGVVRKLK